MTTQLKAGGRGPLLKLTMLLTLALAVLASLFIPTQKAEAVTLPDGPSIATLSVPEDCVDPDWKYMAPAFPDRAYIDADGGRTTMAFVFEPGHHQFRADCATDERTFVFGVTGPTTNTSDYIDEMNWTHRFSKRVEREEIMFHPDFVAASQPEAGYVDTVSWDEWKAKLDNVEIDGVAIDIDIEGLELDLLDRLEERNLIGSAAIIIDPVNGEAWVQVSHIGS